MRIRHATVDDIPALGDVHVESILGSAGTHYSAERIVVWAHPRSAAAWRARIEAGHLYVAEIDGTIVGFGDVDLTAGIVKAVYVDPDFGRRGVGSALLATLEADARASDVHTLQLDASLNAAAFYIDRGFEATATVQHRLRDGSDLECVRMAKVLR
ncbi:MAG: GNAT family N-acetyltransferase [Planctomycetes bacterium]|nr:GNAT family N-acetyltransferase [Planctomycetota bacterium]